MSCTDKYIGYCSTLNLLIDVCVSPYTADCCDYCSKATPQQPFPNKPCYGNLFSKALCQGKRIVDPDFCEIADRWSEACCAFCGALVANEGEWNPSQCTQLFQNMLESQ